MKMANVNFPDSFFLSFCIAASGVLALTATTLAEPEQPAARHYEYNWESIKTAPVRQWFEDAKFGIFIHWGPYSVVGHKRGGRGYAEWLPYHMYRPDGGDNEYYNAYLKDMFGAHPPEFGYKDIVKHFKAENWDPDAWAKLFGEAGARYVILTAEHHDGFAMWDSALTPWTATRVGPMRDLVGDLGEAVREHGMKYVLSYHRERHPSFFAKAMYATESEPREVIAEEIKREPAAAELYGPFEYDAAFVADYVARWKEIQRKYKPDLLWVDHSPVFFKRWNRDGHDDPEIHHFRDACMRMIADYLNAAQDWDKPVYFNNKGNWPSGAGFREADNMRSDTIGPKWQNPATIGTSYGYMREEEENNAYKSPTELIHLLCDVVSKNGNLALNIGPRGDGTIPEGMRTRLLAIGAWLEINGEAIYGTRPWKTWGRETEQMNLRFTARDNHLYVIALNRPAGPIDIAWPDNSPMPEIQSVRLLGCEEQVKWKTRDGHIQLTPPANVPGEHAWAFDIRTSSAK